MFVTWYLRIHNASEVTKSYRYSSNFTLEHVRALTSSQHPAICATTRKPDSVSDPGVSKIPHQEQLDVSTNQSFSGQEYTAKEKEEECKNDGRMEAEEERSREEDVSRDEKAGRGEGRSMQEKSGDENKTSYSPKGQGGLKQDLKEERKGGANSTTSEAVVTQEEPTHYRQSQPKTKPLMASSNTPDTSAVRRKPEQRKETTPEAKAKARPKSTQLAKNSSKTRVPNGAKHPEHKVSSAVTRNAGGQNPSAREPLRTRAASDIVPDSRRRHLKPGQKAASLPNDGARRPCTVQKPKNSSTTDGQNVPARVPLHRRESSDSKRKEVKPQKSAPLRSLRTSPSTAKNPSISGKSGAKSTPKRGSKSTLSIYVRM